MNIFLLDFDPAKAAQCLADTHVVKMALETTQIVCTVLNQAGYVTPYRSTHVNHPCVKWASETPYNLAWLYEHGLALCHEYTARFHKVHKCLSILLDLKASVDTFPATDKAFSWPPQVMPDQYKDRHVVAAYRAYYRSKLQTSKVPLKWTNAVRPEWML